MATIPEIRREFSALTDTLLPPTPPEHLYHYTTHGGLIGIATSKTLWATQIQFMNDEREIMDGATMFRSALLGAHKHGVVGRNFAPFEKWTEVIGVPHFAETGVFASCFSETPDDLSQWRAYCAKGGHCLEFNGPQLFRRIEAERLGTLYKVIYDEAKKAEVAVSLIELASRLWKSLKKAPPKARAARIAVFREELDSALLTCVAVMKDPAFESEAEWRLIANGELSAPSSVQYRPGPSYVIPYVAVPLFRDKDRILTGLIAGPAPSTLAAAGAEQCLSDRGFSKFETLVSSVPYRSW